MAVVAKVPSIHRRGRLDVLHASARVDESAVVAALTAAAHTGAMVALLPSEEDAARLAVAGADDPSELHLTLAYLGDVEDGPEPARSFDDAVFALSTALASGPGAPVAAEVFAHAVFNPASAERDPATVLLVQSGDLTELRGLVQEVLGDQSSFPVWFPHVTLGYNLPPAEGLAERMGPVTFDRVRVAYGSSESVDLPLEESAMTASTRPRVKVVVPDRFRSQTAAVEDDAPEAPAEDEMAAPSPYLGWEGTLVLEGVPTGDGRLMEKGSLRWENLPLPLRWVEKDEGEHKNAVTVGRILEVWRDGQSIMGRGDLDLRIPEAVTLAGLMEDTDGSGPTVSGVSVDLDDVDIEVRVAEDVIAREEAMFADEVEGEVPEREVDAEGRVKVFEFRSDDELMVTVDARIRAATVVAIPAFIDARLALTGPTEEAEGEPLVASAGRRRPPAAWFENPRFGANPRNDPRLVEDEHLGVVACPLTVTDDGQVFGHIAAWRSCHTAFANECVSPPQSATSYRYFHVGALQVDDGRELPVGRLTVDTLHAGRRLSAVDTLAHYEHTGLAVADVVAGEDQHGIWVAGSLRSGVSDEQVARLKASPPSGDWRRIGGNLELVAVLAVNTPGFPVPRALVASGEVRTLQLPGVSRRESPLAELTDDELSVLKRMAVREAAASQERREAAEGARRRMLVASAASRIRGAS